MIQVDKREEYGEIMILDRFRGGVKHCMVSQISSVIVFYIIKVIITLNH